MAKRQWPEGQHITPAFQKAWFGENANEGHNHSGLDQDGSAPKINAITDTTNLFEEISIDVEWVEVSKPLIFILRRSASLKLAYLVIQGAIDTYVGLDTISVDRPGGTAWGADWFPYATAGKIPYVVWYDGTRLAGSLKIPTSVSAPIEFYQLTTAGESGSFQGQCGFEFGMVSFRYDP